jgi:hypothetical protein
MFRDRIQYSDVAGRLEPACVCLDMNTVGGRIVQVPLDQVA